MKHDSVAGALAESKAHDRPLLDQLRLHKRSETAGVCSRAIMEIERLENEIEALLKFKSYVHGRLDDENVPVNPNPDETEKTGCRIGPRLDWVFARISK